MEIIMEYKKLYKNILPLLLVLTSPICSHAWAEIGGSATIEYLENPRHELDSEATDILGIFAINAGYERETQKFITSLNYNASFYDYKDDLLQDRNTLTGSALLSWIIQPDTISWNLTNTRTDLIRSTTSPDTPDNREVLGLTSTGPEISFLLGSANKVDMSATYSIATFSRSEFNDQNRINVNASFERLITERLLLSIRGTAMEADFDSGVQPSYNIYSFSGRLVYNGEKYTISFEKGEYQTKRDPFKEVSSPLLRAQFNYRFNPNSAVYLNYSETVEDPVSEIYSSDSDIDEDLIINPEGTINANIYESTIKSISYSYNSESNHVVQLVFSHNTKTYRTARKEVLDRALLNYSFPLSQRINMSLVAGYSESLFSASGRDQERYNYAIRLGYLLNSSFNLNFSVSKVNQEGNLLIDNYDAFTASIGLRYNR